MEHAVEVDVDHPVPVVVLDLLHRCARPADAGIVDQHVEGAESLKPFIEPARDCVRRAHVRDAAGHAGVGTEHILQALGGQAAYMDARACGVEALCHGAADAAAGAGHHHRL